MQYYTLINNQGKILKSCFTTDSNSPVNPGEKLLPDNPPNPPEYIPGLTRPVRVEPVNPSSTRIEYTFVNEENNPSSNEVVL